MSGSLEEQLSTLMIDNIKKLEIKKYEAQYYNQIIILGIKLMLEGANNINRQLLLEDIPNCFIYDINDAYIGNNWNGLWVLASNNTVYGFISAFIDNDIGILTGIYLESLLRGSGIATELLNKVTDFCKEKKCKELTVEIPSHSPNAKRFLIKNGFEYFNTKMEYENTVEMLYYRLAFYPS